MKSKLRAFGIWIVFFIILSYILNFLSIIFNLFFPSQIPGGLFVAGALFYIANWPSFSLRVFPYIIVDGVKVWNQGPGLLNPLVILSNLLGWSFIGFIVGLVISSIKDRKKNSS
jgi:hypothetical protein